MKKQKVTIRAKTTAIVILILIITVAICIAYIITAREKVTYASTYNENEKSYKTINKNGVDLQEIISKNTTNAKKEEIIKKEIDLEYTTKYNNNPNLPTGMIQVIQEGVDGKQEEITKKTYTGEQLVKEEVVGNIVTKSICYYKFFGRQN